MALPSSGQIAASQINTEFGRAATAQMSIYSARNGAYGFNNCSPKRPTANGQSGYEWSDWYSYNNSAVCPVVQTYIEENSADVNIRYYAYDAYGANYINEFWYYNNQWYANLAVDTGTTIRAGNQIDVLWAWFGWGDYYSYTLKSVYSYALGYDFFNVSGYAGDTVSGTFYPINGDTSITYGFNY